jgi:hypothetical protein
MATQINSDPSRLHLSTSVLPNGVKVCTDLSRGCGMIAAACRGWITRFFWKAFKACLSRTDTAVSNSSPNELVVSRFVIRFGSVRIQADIGKTKYKYGVTPGRPLAILTTLTQRLTSYPLGLVVLSWGSSSFARVSNELPTGRTVVALRRKGD